MEHPARLAPIVLFVYNRPRHLDRVLKALQKNAQAKNSDLFIFSDGAKKDEDKEKVDAVRSIIHSVSGFKSVNIIERERNMGLAASIIDGVTRLTNEYGKAIVLEDDILTSPYFLQYMNDALELYADEEKVGAINGYLHPINCENIPETFFSRYSSCWGWATWERAWKLFQPDGAKLLKNIQCQKQIKDFNIDGAYPYSKMLKKQIAGKNDSWAIRWYASLFLNHMLTLNPGRSLVNNIGIDGTGVHCGESRLMPQPSATDGLVSVEKIIAKENTDVRMAMSTFLKETNSLLAKIRRRLKK